METTRRIPFDADTVSKGDFVSASSLASAFAPDEPGSKGWQFKLMAAQQQLASELTDRYGAEVTVRTHNDGLRVLTDAEASEFNDKAVSRGVRQIRRACRRLSGVVTTDFTPEQKRLHEQRSRKAAMTLLGAVSERQKFEAMERAPIAGQIKGSSVAS